MIILVWGYQEFAYLRPHLTVNKNSAMFEKRITIGIADDHRIFRDGIKKSLLEKENLEIVWEANDGKEMMKRISGKCPDILLMDIRMPEIDGAEALKLIRKASNDVRIIVLSMYDDQQMISNMMGIGANAYLPKTSDTEEIYKAIIACMSNQYYYSSIVNDALVRSQFEKKNERQNYREAKPVDLNENEIKVLQLLAADMATEDISKTIFLSPRTVETIRQRLKIKINVKSIGGLLKFGLAQNLIK